MWEEYMTKWWLIVMRGLLAVLAGILLIVWPVKSLVVITTLVGLFMLIEGVVAMIVSLFHINKDDDWWVIFFQGLVALLIGVAIFAVPQLTLAALLFLVAIWIFVAGIAMLFQAFSERDEEFGGEWILTAGGIVLLLLSFVLFSNPQVSLALTAIIIGVVLLLSGIFTTTMGLQVKGFVSQVKRQTKTKRLRKTKR